MSRKMIEIERVLNGYVIECRAPIKPEEKDNADSMVSCYPGSEEANFVAKDEAEVVEIVQKLMPMLDVTFTSEDEFNMAFEKVA